MNVSEAPPRGREHCSLIWRWWQVGAVFGAPAESPSALLPSHPGLLVPWSPQSTSKRLCQHSPAASARDNICPQDLGRLLWRLGTCCRRVGGSERGEAGSGEAPPLLEEGEGSQASSLSHLYLIVSLRVYPHPHLSVFQVSLSLWTVSSSLSLIIALIPVSGSLSLRSPLSESLSLSFYSLSLSLGSHP